MAKTDLDKLFTKVTGVTESLDDFKQHFLDAYEDDGLKRFQLRVKALVGEGAMFDNRDFERVKEAQELLETLGIGYDLSAAYVEDSSDSFDSFDD